MKLIVVTPDGEVTEHDFPEENSFEFIKENFLGNAHVEVKGLCKDVVCYLDEEGTFKNLPFNSVAQNIFLDSFEKQDLVLMGHIVGNAVFVGRKEGKDGFAETDIPDDFVKEYFSGLALCVEADEWCNCSFSVRLTDTPQSIADKAVEHLGKKPDVIYLMVNDTPCPARYDQYTREKHFK